VKPLTKRESFVVDILIYAMACIGFVIFCAEVIPAILNWGK
jgi:hypothetical protein